MNHILFFESYNRKDSIESSIYSYDNEEAGFYSGVVYNDMANINTWLITNGYNGYYDTITQHGLPITFLDRIEIEEDYRNQGLGNQGLDDFIEEATRYGAKSVVLVSDNGHSQLEGFKLENWYVSKGFEVLVPHPYGSLMILKLNAESEYNEYEEDSDY